MGDDPAKKETVHSQYEARQMERLQMDVKLGETGFGPGFDVGGESGFGSIFGRGPTTFSSCRGCGAVIRLDEIVEVDGKVTARAIMEHFQFHERIGDPLKAVDEG